MIQDLKVLALGVVVGCLALAACFATYTMTTPDGAERAAYVEVP
jgi:hypothetical protein